MAASHHLSTTTTTLTTLTTLTTNITTNLTATATKPYDAEGAMKFTVTVVLVFGVGVFGLLGIYHGRNTTEEVSDKEADEFVKRFEGRRYNMEKQYRKRLMVDLVTSFFSRTLRAQAQERPWYNRKSTLRPTLSEPNLLQTPSLVFDRQPESGDQSQDTRTHANDQLPVPHNPMRRLTLGATEMNRPKQIRPMFFQLRAAPDFSGLDTEAERPLLEEASTASPRLEAKRGFAQQTQCSADGAPCVLRHEHEVAVTGSQRQSSFPAVSPGSVLDTEVSVPHAQERDRTRGTGDRPHETGDRPQKTGDRPHETGDRPHETGDRPYQTGDRPYQTGDRPYQTGDRPYQTGDRPHETGDRPYQTGDRPYQTGDRPYQTGDRPYQTGEREHETGDRPQKTGERAHENGDREHETGVQETGERPHKTRDRPHKTGDMPQKTGDSRQHTGGMVVPIIVVDDWCDMVSSHSDNSRSHRPLSVEFFPSGDQTSQDDPSDTVVFIV